MSSFTRFDARVLLQYDEIASALLGREYWRVMNGFVYYIGSENSKNFVVIPKGFLTDGASVPSIARSLVPRLGSHGQAAILHDYLCENYFISRVVNNEVVRVNINRKTADHIFYEAMQVLEVPTLRYKLIKVAVDLYRFMTNPKAPRVNKEKRILEDNFT